MIEYIKGKLDDITPTMAVVDCNGVGYGINISLNTFSAIQGKTDVKLSLSHGALTGRRLYDKYRDRARAHDKFPLDPHFFTLFVKIVSIAVPIGIDAQMPGKVILDGRQRDLNVFPIGIHRDIDNVVLPLFAVIACEADGKRPGIRRQGQLVAVQVVDVERIHAADGIRQLFPYDSMF